MALLPQPTQYAVMKKPTLSFWNVRVPWIDMLVCFIISALAPIEISAK